MVSSSRTSTIAKSTTPWCAVGVESDTDSMAPTTVIAQLLGAVDAVAPSRHAGNLGAVVMRQHGDELARGAWEHRPDDARRRFRSGSGFGGFPAWQAPRP